MAVCLWSQATWLWKDPEKPWRSHSHRARRCRCAQRFKLCSSIVFLMHCPVKTQEALNGPSHTERNVMLFYECRIWKMKWNDIKKEKLLSAITRREVEMKEKKTLFIFSRSELEFHNNTLNRLIYASLFHSLKGGWRFLLNIWFPDSSEIWKSVIKFKLWSPLNSTTTGSVSHEACRCPPPPRDKTLI